jgi:hypothetical protein
MKTILLCLNAIAQNSFKQAFLLSFWLSSLPFSYPQVTDNFKLEFLAKFYLIFRRFKFSLQKAQSQILKGQGFSFRPCTGETQIFFP